MNEKLWDEEHSIYLDFDLVAQRLIYVYVAPNFVPLFAGIPDEERAGRMVSALENAGFGLSDESITPVPGYDRYGFAFFPTRYWRGPVWININWFLALGLDRYGYEDHARRLRKTYFFTTFRNVAEEPVARKGRPLGPRKTSHRASKGAHTDEMVDRRHLVKSLYSIVPARAAMG